MAVKYLAGDRIIGTAAERAALSGNTLGSVAQTSWKLLVKKTLSSDARFFDTGTFAAKDNLMILMDIETDQTNADPTMWFNDEGGNSGDGGTGDQEYAKRQSFGGGSESTSTDATYIFLNGGIADMRTFHIAHIRNIATKEKYVRVNSAEETASGSTTMKIVETTGKWDNTSEAITKINFGNYQGSGSRNFKSGTEIVVLGCDDDEADSGTNFWTESGRASATSAAEVHTGTMTGMKDYVWIQAYCKGGNTNDNFINFNDDEGSNYANLYSRNGGSYASDTGQGVGLRIAQGTTTEQFCNMFVVNKATKRKLGFGYTVRDQAGGDANRQMFSVKWNNSSDQITDVGLDRASSTFTYGIIRVWVGE